ncbi:hypothetical protein [Sulfitobacter indolifex]|uniref:hypothetical protein n=1 Tax=Sulfitobacter indolifex TaxID=225422 RepID=UPI00103B0D39|nr:hypothetical protein [Sulfitobacter indolifex]
MTHDHDKGTPNDKQRVRYVEKAMASRILSLSGGGYMGLYTAAVLAGLEEQWGDSLYKKFDRVDACPVLIRISLDGASRQVARLAKRQTGIGAPDIRNKTR